MRSLCGKALVKATISRCNTVLCGSSLVQHPKMGNGKSTLPNMYQLERQRLLLPEQICRDIHPLVFERALQIEAPEDSGHDEAHFGHR